MHCHYAVLSSSSARVLRYPSRTCHSLLRTLSVHVYSQLIQPCSRFNQHTSINVDLSLTSYTTYSLSLTPQAHCGFSVGGIDYMMYEL